MKKSVMHGGFAASPRNCAAARCLDENFARLKVMCARLMEESYVQNIENCYGDDDSYSFWH